MVKPPEPSADGSHPGRGAGRNFELRNSLSLCFGLATLPGRKGNNDNISGGFAKLHHRLISVTPPAQKTQNIFLNAMEISFAKRVAVAPDTLINVVGEEAVLLNLKNEQYYGLDVMGTEMWQALTASSTISEAYEKLLSEYDVSAEVLEKDLNDLLEKLLSNGLVELQGE